MGIFQRRNTPLFRSWQIRRINRWIKTESDQWSVFSVQFKNIIEMHVELKEGKRYYSIGEVAKAFNVNASLIRFWDKEFDILKPKKNAKGNRMFTPEDVKNLQLIYHLVKERGFTLDGARTHLKEGQKKTLDKFEIISKLETVKAQLLNIKNQL
jgi:DNA-binding transcriptional MerR regulator